MKLLDFQSEFEKVEIVYRVLIQREKQWQVAKDLRVS